MADEEPVSLDRKVDRIHFRLDTMQKQLDKIEHQADTSAREYISRVEFEAYRKAMDLTIERIYKDQAAEIAKVNSANYWPNRIVIVMAGMVLIAFFGYVINSAFK
jgi:hypothetical protein